MNPSRLNQLNEVTLRVQSQADDCGLARLAELDEASLPAPPLLLAEVRGELRAALSLVDGGVVADPFYPTLQLVDLLHTRAKHMRQPTPRARRWRGGLARAPALNPRWG